MLVGRQVGWQAKGFTLVGIANTCFTMTHQWANRTVFPSFAPHKSSDRVFALHFPGRTGNRARLIDRKANDTAIGLFAFVLRGAALHGASLIIAILKPAPVGISPLALILATCTLYRTRHCLRHARINISDSAHVFVVLANQWARIR